MTHVLPFASRLPVLLAAALAVLLTLASASPARAATPSQRTVTDAAESAKAYDIRSTTLRAARAEGRRAKVVVRHDRRVRVGDATQMWLQLDGDAQPDVYLIGYSFSEFTVYRTNSWTRYGKNISNRGCVSLAMVGKRSVVTFDPSCLGASKKYAVSVRSFRPGVAARTADHAPAKRTFTKKVLTYRTS